MEATEQGVAAHKSKTFTNKKARVYGLFQREKSNPLMGRIKSPKREFSNPFEGVSVPAKVFR